MSEWNTEDGIYLGFAVKDPIGRLSESVLSSEWKESGHINVYREDRHLVTIGPNGSGKTRKLNLPNLYRLHSYSMLVVDPKGELAVWTAQHRAKNGSEIVTFDPFGVIERRYPGMVKELPYLKSKEFNPIAMLDPVDDDFADDAKALSEALIKVDGRDSHWGQSAQALLTGLIMGLRMTLKPDDPDNSLAGLRDAVGMAPDELGGYISELIEATPNEPAIAAKLNRFAEIHLDNRELLSILSTAVAQTDWMDSRPIRRQLRGGKFDFSEMKRRPVTVYLVLPPRYLETHSRWLRLMITAVLTPLIRSTAKGVPVLFMLDEFAQLGRLEVVERNLALMRSYGVQLWMVLQDLAQLEDNYKSRWNSFMANAGVIQSFAPQDLKTRRYLSELSGKNLIWIGTYSTTQSSSYSWNYVLPNMSTTTGQTSLLENVFPEDSLAQMQNNQSVIFQARLPPRRTLLPDPSELQEFDTAEILSRANAFAAQYEVNDDGLP